MVLKRKVALETFPFTTATEKTALPTPSGPDREGYLKLLREALVRQFSFDFSAQVGCIRLKFLSQLLDLVTDKLRQIRVKQRLGRLHRLLVASSNEVKGKFLKPHFDVDFCLRPGDAWIDDLVALGTRVDPFQVDVKVDNKVAEMLRQDLVPDASHGNEKAAPEAGEADSHDPPTKTDAPSQQDPGKTSEDEEKEPEIDSVAHEETLEDKVDRACKPPETAAPFRYPFGKTVDIDSMLDEAKTKASTPTIVWVANT